MNSPSAQAKRPRWPLMAAIIAFAHRYPVGRFPIDDETATASSLLLITREAVRICAPAELARLEAAK